MTPEKEGEEDRREEVRPHEYWHAYNKELSDVLKNLYRLADHREVVTLIQEVGGRAAYHHYFEGDYYHATLYLDENPYYIDLDCDEEE